MGQAGGKPIIIEFNGIPGSGKTTTMFELRKLLKEMKVPEIPDKAVSECEVNRLTILHSREIRACYITFLKAFFLIRPIRRERFRIMNRTFHYWYGIKLLSQDRERKQTRICILDQGIIQGFVSMAFQGKILNEGKYCQYIKQVLDSLGNFVCINCNTDVNVSVSRMRQRTHKLSRLDFINNNRELRKALINQKKQFERIRETAIKKAVSIDMNESPEDNAERILLKVGLEK